MTWTVGDCEEAHKSARWGLDYRLGPFVNKSVLAPCLVAALGFAEFKELVLGDATEADTWLELLYEVLACMLDVLLTWKCARELALSLRIRE